MKRAVLGLFGFLLIICLPAHAGVLGGKKMIRVYESAGDWCQFPYRYVHPDDPSDLDDPEAVTTFTATDSTATLLFEVDNRDPGDNEYYDFLSNRIDNVLVVKSGTLQNDSIWRQFGCYHTFPGFTSYFDFTQLPAGDPRIVFQDSFVGAPSPGWTGLWSGEASWISGGSSLPLLSSVPAIRNGALEIGSQGGPPKASSSITLSGLEPGQDYDVSFWWSASVPPGGIEMAVRVFDEPPQPLNNRQMRPGTVSDQIGWTYYYVDVPRDTSELVIDLTGLSADADLYVSHGDPPDFGQYDCALFYGGTVNERCSFAAPAPGRWWVGIVNWDTGVISYNLQATWQASLDFFTVIPCRVLDSRSGSPPYYSGYLQLVSLAGKCGIPASAKAVSVNLTALGPSGTGNLKLWPANLPEPATSSINFAPGLNRANNAILTLATDGFGDLAARSFVTDQGLVHLIIDVNGYFE